MFKFVIVVAVQMSLFGAPRTEIYSSADEYASHGLCSAARKSAQKLMYEEAIDNGWIIEIKEPTGCYDLDEHLRMLERAHYERDH